MARTMHSRQILLLVTALGLIPIAVSLSYGVQPGETLRFLFDVSVSNVNGTHLFRAIMGLYLALELIMGVSGLQALRKSD
jgi:hypothetical protein